MTVEDVDMKDASQEEVAPLEPFPTISILQLVKDAQQAHGLRHGDYNRYRIYCKDKLRRVRSALKVTNPHKCVRKHKAKFTKRPIAEESFNDQRYVQIALFEVERRWAQAMHCKTELEDNAVSRKKHQLRSALKRAVQHAAVLESLIKASPRCDAPTKLECQAYAVWLKGIVAFELREWASASVNLKAAQDVYERLAGATPNSTLASLYKAKCREIQPQLRLCDFNSREGGNKATVSELMALRDEMGANNTDSIDHLIAEMRSKAQTTDAAPIEWAGVIAPAGEEKVRAIIDSWAQTDKELKECTEPKQKMALLEKQIADTRDVIEKLIDGQRRKVAEGTGGIDSQEANRLRGYLDFVRMSRTAERYLAIIEHTKLEKKHKPQDLLRLYDSVIEILKEITKLDGADNKNLQTAYGARIEYYRTFRCYYMACAYSSLGRYDEAIALFERTKERMITSEKMIKAIGGGNQYLIESVDSLSALKSDLERATVTAKAERLAKAAEGLNVDENKAEEIDERALVDTMDEWREWKLTGVGAASATTTNAKGKKARSDGEQPVIPIANFPPPMLPMPVKPMFFDLAMNHIVMPDLDERIAALEESAKKEATPAKTNSKAQASGGKKAVAGAKEVKKEEPAAGGGVMGWFWGKK